MSKGTQERSKPATAPLKVFVVLCESDPPQRHLRQIRTQNANYSLSAASLSLECVCFRRERAKDAKCSRWSRALVCLSMPESPLLGK